MWSKEALQELRSSGGHHKSRENNNNNNNKASRFSSGGISSSSSLVLGGGKSSSESHQPSTAFFSKEKDVNSDEQDPLGESDEQDPLGESDEEEEEKEDPVNRCSVIDANTNKSRKVQNLSNLESTICGCNRLVDDMFSVTDSSTASGSETLGNAIEYCFLFIIYLFYIFISLIVDNSSPTSYQPTGTRNYLKKRKSEGISSECSLEYKSSEKISFFDSFGVCLDRRIKIQPILRISYCVLGREHRTSMQSKSSSFQKLVGQTNRFNAYLALPDDPVRARKLSAKDLDVTLIHLVPKCLMSLKIHEPTKVKKARKL